MLKRSSLICYFFAGAFLTNSMPHLVVAATGRRNLTPFGQDSSPEVNLLWAGMNLASSYALVRLADKLQETGEEVKPTAWQLPYEAGCLFWSSFGVLYSWLTR